MGARLSNSHWVDFHRRWAQLRPPLRPNLAVVEGFRQAIAGHAARVLLLGVTPELTELGTTLVGVDQSDMMISKIWPGDTARRWVVRADWRKLPFPEGHFSAAIGDGSLNVVTYPNGQRQICEQVSKVVRPGGRFACRLFKTPDHAETVRTVCDAAMNAQIGSFHAFKWRFAMALVAASGDPNIHAAAILEAFNREFPDRAQLVMAGGWPAADIATIDVYQGSAEIYSFPTLAQFQQMLPATLCNLRLLAAGSYELAERCPIVVLDLA